VTGEVPTNSEESQTNIAPTSSPNHEAQLNTYCACSFDLLKGGLMNKKARWNYLNATDGAILSIGSSGQPKNHRPFYGDIKQK
jgi:hypothetical protein